jgi:hypothetical protein
MQFTMHFRHTHVQQSPSTSHQSLLAPRTREKIDTIEPTLPLSSLVYLVLFPCSLQTCSVFPFYEVLVSIAVKINSYLLIDYLGNVRAA